MTQSYQTHEFSGGCRDCGLFFLDLTGQFDRAQVCVVWTDRARATNPQVERLIEDTWRNELTAACQDKRMLFDGRMCRLVDCATDGRTVELTLGPTTFKEYVGTNLFHAGLRYVHGVDVLADPVGVSAVLTTRDGFVVLGRRGPAVMRYAGWVHPVGGVVAPPDDASVAPDPFDTMLRELREETDLPAGRVTRQVCVGLVREKQTVQPELIFDVSADVDVEELRRMRVGAVDANEHTELVTVRDHPGALVTFMERNKERLTPVCLASLLLHGQLAWGSGWLATARGYLGSVI